MSHDYAEDASSCFRLLGDLAIVRDLIHALHYSAVNLCRFDMHVQKASDLRTADVSPRLHCTIKIGVFRKLFELANLKI